MRSVMALVLSGGGGEQLGILTSERAVSAVPYGGKFRIVDFVLSNCCHSGIPLVGVLTQHAPTSLHDHIGVGRTWDLDRRGGGVLILQPYLTRGRTGWYRGTADAIAQNWDVIEESRPDRVLVLPGDQVSRVDYRPLIEMHERRGAALTLAVSRVPPEDSRRFGMVTVDGEGRVRGLREKPERAETPYASMGIYLFETEVLAESLRPRPVNLVLDVVAPLVDAGLDVRAHEFQGYWEDVGTVGSFYRANLELVAPEPRLLLHDPSWPILTRDEERPPVRVRTGAAIEESVVANGCRVEGRVRRSVLFPGVRVECDAEVTDSIVLADTRVERGARVAHAIVDKYAAIEAGARVGEGPVPPDAASAWLEGVTLIGKDARVPARAVVGRSAVVGIGARAEDFAGGGLAAGSVIRSRPWYEEPS